MRTCAARVRIRIVRERESQTGHPRNTTLADRYVLKRDSRDTLFPATSRVHEPWPCKNYEPRRKMHNTYIVRVCIQIYLVFHTFKYNTYVLRKDKPKDKPKKPENFDC